MMAVSRLTAIRPNPGRHSWAGGRPCTHAYKQNEATFEGFVIQPLAIKIADAGSAKSGLDTSPLQKFMSSSFTNGM